MKKYVFISLALIVVALGCAKKEETMEVTGEAMTMEALTAPSAGAPAAVTPEVKAPAAKTDLAVPAVAPKLEPLPPAGPFKPTTAEIQTALKAAGFYAGEVDGKIGPKTKKAIEDFQKANNLKVDGKVGPKTWEALSKAGLKQN